MTFETFSVVEGELQLPISVKGVVIDDGQVVLVRNRRDEWELPGGKLELDEDPADCVAREIEEEVGWSVRADRVVDVWVYTIWPGRVVFIVTYLCSIVHKTPELRSPEGKPIRLFPLEQVAELDMPDGYKDSIRSAWSAMTGDS
jgi:8-oxo-dGTP pyrophosphatase MutT (NUDIX family)